MRPKVFGENLTKINNRFGSYIKHNVWYDIERDG